jgi:PAS domain-containing protein
MAVVKSWVVVASNIDEQVQASQQRRALFEALPVGVLVYSKAASGQDCNAAALEMLGLRRDQMGAAVRDRRRQ